MLSQGYCVFVVVLPGRISSITRFCRDPWQCNTTVVHDGAELLDHWWVPRGAPVSPQWLCRTLPQPWGTQSGLEVGIPWGKVHLPSLAEDSLEQEDAGIPFTIKERKKRELVPLLHLGLFMFGFLFCTCLLSKRLNHRNTRVGQGAAKCWAVCGAALWYCGV